MTEHDEFWWISYRNDDTDPRVEPAQVWFRSEVANIAFLTRVERELYAGEFTLIERLAQPAAVAIEAPNLPPN